MSSDAETDNGKSDCDEVSSVDNGEVNTETSDGANANPFSQQSAALQEVMAVALFCNFSFTKFAFLFTQIYRQNKENKKKREKATKNKAALRASKQNEKAVAGSTSTTTAAISKAAGKSDSLKKAGTQKPGKASKAAGTTKKRRLLPHLVFLCDKKAGGCIAFDTCYYTRATVS